MWMNIAKTFIKAENYLIVTFTSQLHSAIIANLHRLKAPDHIRFKLAVVAMLLLMSGVEPNPGPIVAVASLNANSIVRKGPLIRAVVETHLLDLLAVCETWVADDDPDAVKLDAVPAGFRVTHQPRSTATVNKRDGGLCVIHRDSLIVKQHPLQQRLRCRTF
jgi:hypothetical protein